MSYFSFKSYSRSTETSFFPWKSQKIEKSIFFKMVDFSLFFAICILYLHFVFRVCLFVFFPFWLLVFCCWSPWSRERLISNSRVVIDHRNRHHHHQIGNHYKSRPKNQFSRNLLKTMLDFFFCPIQQYIEMYCDEEESGKS